MMMLPRKDGSKYSHGSTLRETKSTLLDRLLPKCRIILLPSHRSPCESSIHTQSTPKGRLQWPHMAVGITHSHISETSGSYRWTLPYMYWQMTASAMTLLHPVYSVSSCLAAPMMPVISTTSPVQAKTNVEEVIDGFRRCSELLNSPGDFRGQKNVRRRMKLLLPRVT